ncbi:hypothetical protein Bbelb_390790 [Branchiostoma belcheri]|nr:hypothetical protein Bbelb_412810 [Branchiostoma belcheri]KAI8483197.1 hypothetical protein Bbelb_390790 [Branchiostoma belcheri]
MALEVEISESIRNPKALDVVRYVLKSSQYPDVGAAGQGNTVSTRDRETHSASETGKHSLQQGTQSAPGTGKHIQHQEQGNTVSTRDKETQSAPGTGKHSQGQGNTVSTRDRGNTVSTRDRETQLATGTGKHARPEVVKSNNTSPTKKFLGEQDKLVCLNWCKGHDGLAMLLEWINIIGTAAQPTKWFDLEAGTLVQTGAFHVIIPAIGRKFGLEQMEQAA